MTTCSDPFCRHVCNFTVLITTVVTLLAASDGSAAIVRDYGPPLVTEQDRSELVLSTNFWRAEFQQGADPAATDEDRGSAEGTRAGGAKHLGQSDIAAVEDLYEEEVAITLDTGTDQGTAVSESTAVLSEWERAVCNAVGPDAKKMNQKGPSAVTAIVAVVGAIVVFGAYFKSSRKS